MAPKFSRICQLLAVAALLPAQTPPLTDEVLLLSRIRRAALDSLKTIPSYTCLETIERGTRVSPKQRYRPLDTVQLEVAEFGKRELFAWPGQTNFEEKDGQILGLSSYGEFYAHLNAIMAGSAAIHYSGKEECDGQACVRYDFTLGQAFANWTLTTATGSGQAAESGSFWADPQSSKLYRLLIKAEEIPLFLGISSAELEIRYGATSLIENRPGRNGYFFSPSGAFQLPQTFSLHLILRSGEESENVVSFTQCRAYQSESKLVAEASSDTAPEPPVKEITLPGRLTVEISLTAPVRSGVDHVGDRVDAVIGRDVKDKRHVYLPRGAQIIGRVRRLEHQLTPYEYWIVALEFTDVAFTQDGVTGHARFTGNLQFFDTLALQQEIEIARAEGIDLGATGRLEKTRSERLIPRQLPGVATFIMRGPMLTVPKGFHMTWVTTSSAK